VENRCTFDTQYNEGYDPLVFARVAQINKGNVLQYKKNSSNLTKQQRYSQIAKGLWTNRTKTYATQSDVYTNPNVLSLKRVNYKQSDRTDVNDPFDCPLGIRFKDGGTLICGTYENPCTGQVIERVLQPNYHPTTDSDVPGPIKLLYWDPRLQTWYPKTRLNMNNSSDKWPVNYKLFRSAVELTSRTTDINNNNNNNNNNNDPYNPVNPDNKDIVISGNTITLVASTIDIGDSNTNNVNVEAKNIDIGSNNATPSVINIGNTNNPIKFSGYINQLTL
jgi:hypothetical protein